MYFDTENEITPVLISNEKILWMGRPGSGIRFRAADIYLIPFSMLWFGFAIFWEYSVLKMGVSIMAIFGVPFIVAGFYIFAGRFIWDMIKRKRTVYAVTNDRVIIKSGVFNKVINSYYIKTIPALNLTEKNDGSGTITFGQNSGGNSFFNNSRYVSGFNPPTGLEFIEEVRKVYSLIVAQQRGA